MNKFAPSLLALVLSLPLAHAQTAWRGGGADSLWSNPDNWDTGQVPDGSEQVFFDGANTTTNMNDISGLTLSGGDIKLRVGNQADWTLNGATISIADNSNISVDGEANIANARTHTFNLGLDIGANGATAVSMGSNVNLIFNGLVVGDRGQENKAWVFQPGNSNSVLYLTNNENSFTHYPHFRRSITEAATIANAGEDSALGAGDHIVLGQTADTGTLRYVGTGSSTDRQVRVGNGSGGGDSGGGSILNNGTGALHFTAPTFSRQAVGTTATRTLTLGGTHTGTNTIAGIIADNNTANGATISVEVSGSTWRLDGDNTHTGATIVSGGALILNGSTDSASVVTVRAGGAIGGNGAIGGPLTLEDGALFAFDTANTLTIEGALTIDSSFGVASLRDPNGRALDWSTISDGTHTLLDGPLAPTFSASNIGNFGPANAADIGGGRIAHFQSGGLQLVVLPKPHTD